MFKTNTLEFVKNESLTIIKNFGIESVLSNGSRFTFSESPYPGPDSLYKVCLYKEPCVLREK